MNNPHIRLLKPEEAKKMHDLFEDARDYLVFAQRARNEEVRKRCLKRVQEISQELEKF